MQSEDINTDTESVNKMAIIKKRGRPVKEKTKKKTPKPVGRPKKEGGQYVLEIDGIEKKFNSMRDMSEKLNKPLSAIHRLVNNGYIYKKNYA